MSTTVLPSRLSPGAIRRGLLAGIAWGVGMGVALPALGAIQCGAICLSDVVMTTAIASLAGMATFGPLVALMPRTR